MSLSHRVGVTYTTNAGTVSATTNTYTGTGEATVNESLAIGTNTPVIVAIDVSALQSLLLYSDKALTIKTNSSSVPDDTIVLKAGVPVYWNTDSVEACPLTADVTEMFCTNAAVAAFKVSALMDATP